MRKLAWVFSLFLLLVFLAPHADSRSEPIRFGDWEDPDVPAIVTLEVTKDFVRTGVVDRFSKGFISEPDRGFKLLWNAEKARPGLLRRFQQYVISPGLALESIDEAGREAHALVRDLYNREAREYVEALSDPEVDDRTVLALRPWWMGERITPYGSSDTVPTKLVQVETKCEDCDGGEWGPCGKAKCPTDCGGDPRDCWETSTGRGGNPYHARYTGG